MKLNKNIAFAFAALIIVAAFYRIIPGRPLGFAPQIAMALFAGSVIKDRKYAFTLPLFSMFLSDLVFQSLFNSGWSSIPGFYEGQLLNYILFGGLTVIGFWINQTKAFQIGLASLAGPTVYFLISNLLVWMSGGGFNRPKTVSGLLMAYTDGIPFYTGSIVATFLFSAMLFGGYTLVRSGATRTQSI